MGKTTVRVYTSPYKKGEQKGSWTSTKSVEDTIGIVEKALKEAGALEEKSE